MIHRLPQYLINKLKAGEIVERPASVVKELVENSLDANSSNIEIELLDGGKKMIKVDDNWIWISKDDLPLAIERYATSKIVSEKDLENILTYWFRWEALAAISEVSKFKLQSKTTAQPIWYELFKVNKNISLKPIPFYKEHWTVVYVEDLFYNVPVRRKYLKSKQTEEKYIKQIFVNFSLANFDKWFKLISDKKVIFNLSPVDNLLDRILQIYWDNIIKHLKFVENYVRNDFWFFKLYWFVSDSWLSFSSPDNMLFFVNKRPIHDKIIKKAVMQAYYRQISPDEYPLVILFLDITPSFVDVNVHPRKLEVRFKDPGSIYNFVYDSIVSIFEKDKINFGSLGNFKDSYDKNFTKDDISKAWRSNFTNKWLNLDFSKQVTTDINIFSKQELNNYITLKWYNFKIIWQLWNTYILLEDNKYLYIVDQHALAERIIFEKMRDEVLKKWLVSRVLFTPIIIDVSKLIDNLDKKNWTIK
jgi:DNA mismatch repair protein MutL